MALTREIEKLQRSWQENPLGLRFAPLAEAYRKEGMAGDALDLLAIGLAQHPNYVPAHIVRGRCFLDARDDRSAESAFRRVTELDAENVIALKALADIAERAGRFPDAMTRLERLLEVDHANDEAREQYDRLRATVANPGLGRDAAHIAATLAAAEAAPEPVAQAEVVAVPVAVEPVEPEGADDNLHLDSDDQQDEVPMISAAIREDVEVIRFDPVELSASPENVYQRGSDAEGLRPAEARGGLAESGEAAPDPVTEPASVAEAAAAVEVEVEVPVAAAAIEPEPELEPEPETQSADMDDAEAVAGFEAEPELVVTETMAELFLRQGHKELALAVYSQLAARDPDQPRIRMAIDQLQSEVRREAPSLPVFAAVLTGGQSVRAFFEQLLAASRPAAPGAVIDPGLSLGAVFGDEASAASPPAPAVEAGPTFDEFYGGEPGIEATAPTATSGPGEDAVAADLETFTSWLKGLKR